jgi:hypothetical protein
MNNTSSSSGRLDHCGSHPHRHGGYPLAEHSVVMEAHELWLLPLIGVVLVLVGRWLIQ